MRYLSLKRLWSKPYYYLILLGWVVLLPHAFAAPCLDVPQTADNEISSSKKPLSQYSNSTTIYSCTCYLNGHDKTSPDVQFLSYSRTVTTLARYLFDSSSCEDEKGNNLFLNSELCTKNTYTRVNSTYYFQNTTEPNEYFACSTNNMGRFAAYRVGLKKCDDGRFIDSNGDCAAPHVEPEFKVLEDAEQYTLSVAGDQVHIRSLSPNIDLDCQYGQGACSYAFNTNLQVDLEVVNIKMDESLAFNDYEITWSGHPDCDSSIANTRIFIYKDKHCDITVSKKQYVKDRETNANQLNFLNFSGHGISGGGEKDIVLGFILEGESSTQFRLHVESIDYIVSAGLHNVPQANFYQVLQDEAGNFYGNLLYENLDGTDISAYISPLRDGIYTMQLAPSDFAPQNHRRGMAGISLKSTALTLSNLSVRGHLKELVGLNFIVDGVGSQKMSISSNLLQGQAETQLILSNLSTGQILFHGVGLTRGVVDISAGAYAATLNTLSGEGIGMIEVNLIR